MEKPLVSFVMPTKDRIEWVAEAVMSVLGQTERNIEFIIINDGSSDGTKEFLDEWVAKDTRVRIVHNEKSLGAGPCRHLGAEMAKADIVCIVDDDDINTDERAAVTLKWFKEHPESELVTFPYVSIGYNNEIIERFDGKAFDHEEYERSGAINYYCNPSTAVKRESYLATDGFKKENAKETDDHQFVRNWIKAGKKIDFCPGEFLLMHRVLPNSMMAGLRGWDPKWVGA